MKKINIAIGAWIVFGVSVFVVGTAIPADCTPAYSVELSTVNENSANNVMEYANLSPAAQESFISVRNGEESSIDSTVYDQHFEDTTIKHSDTYYRVTQNGSLDCGTPIGTLLQYAGFLLVSLMSSIIILRKIYKITK